MTTFTARYTQLLERIHQACQQVDRRPEEITLIAVSKTHPVSALLEAYEAGLRHFGENRIDEIAEKRPVLEKQGYTATWHYIADPQSRHTAVVADYADLLHALDRPKIAQRLAHRLQETGRGKLDVLIQVNISGETSKSGVNCQTWETDPSQQQQLLQLITAAQNHPQLHLKGLMTMAPWDVEEPLIRSVFQRTRQLRDWLKTQQPGLQLPYLSMGMTDDFELAIQEGATHIRVGRALFGERH